MKNEYNFPHLSRERKIFFAFGIFVLLPLSLFLFLFMILYTPNLGPFSVIILCLSLTGVLAYLFIRTLVLLVVYDKKRGMIVKFRWGVSLLESSLRFGMILGSFERFGQVFCVLKLLDQNKCVGLPAKNLKPIKHFSIEEMLTNSSSCVRRRALQLLGRDIELIDEQTSEQIRRVLFEANIINNLRN